MSPKKILSARYIGYTQGTENHGDESLYWIIKDLLAPEIIVDAQAEEYDIALLGGGTLINQSPWLIDEFAASLDKPACGLVFGTGVGDTAFWGNRFTLWSTLLRRCLAIGVRGPESVALLHANGITEAKLIGDPYLWLRPVVERPVLPKTLGVNVGSTNNSLWGTNDQELVEFIAEVLSRLKTGGWQFQFFSVWSRDFPLLEFLRERVGVATAPVWDVRKQPLESYCAAAGCELFLGEKLHALALAVVTGTPFIGLEYQPKIVDFAASLNMRAWVVSTAERDVEKLLTLILAMQADRQQVVDNMLAQRDALRKKIIAFAQEIKSLFIRTVSSS